MVFEKIILSLCLFAPIFAHPSIDPPLNCVLNEKRPNPSNRNTYYECLEDGPVLMKCSDNMVFDSQKTECIKFSLDNLPVNNISVAKIPISGGWSSAPPPPPSGPPPPPSGPPPSGLPPPPPGWSGPLPTSPPSSWPEPPNPSGWTETPTLPPSGWSPPTPPPNPVGACPAVDPANAVYLPDMEDCTKFYECSNGTPYQFDCPDNLCFNPYLDVCDNEPQLRSFLCGPQRSRYLAMIQRIKEKEKGNAKPLV